MSLSDLDQISDLLLRLRLVDALELSRVRGQLSGAASADDLLELLERRHLLTSYQTERIRKSDTDGLVIGNCKLLYRNASGSFARVYRACALSDGSMIGMKVLRERWSSDADMLRLFQREGEIGRRLKHKNIVPVFDVGTDRNHHYITMEFVEGGNLRDFLRIRGKLAPEEACRYVLDTAQALEYALGLGITHRDMKLTNVLMSSQGVAKLIDFGLAVDDKLLSRLGSSDLQQAVEYTTLERNTSAPPNDPRSDLFFLGVILYELLTGTPPYARTRSVAERKQFSRYRDVRPVTSLEPLLPRRVVGLVDRLMHVNPNERFQSPTDLVTETRSLLAELGVAHENGVEDNGSGAFTILCVENRPKQQDLLRQYLSRHGYRVLLVSDVERAMARVRQHPPDCFVLMGEAVGDRVTEDYQRALKLGRERSVVGVLVLGENQAHLRDSAAPDPLGFVLVQPIRLRDVRDAINQGLEQRGQPAAR
jgi:CheY-like chemotaxis protein